MIVDLEEQPVIKKRGGAGRAPARPHLIDTEVSLPEELAVHVEAVQPVHAKVGIDVLAIGHRGFRGVGVGAVPRHRRPAFFHGRVPDLLTRLSVEADHPILVDDLHQVASVAAVAAVVGLRLGGFLDSWVGGHRGRHEETIAPDNGLRPAFAFEGNLPADVGLLAVGIRPDDRERRGGNGVCCRAAKLRIVLSESGCWDCQQACGEQAGEDRGFHDGIS